MTLQTTDGAEVTLEFSEETIEALDDKAFHDHRGNRAAAVRELLDEWLTAQHTEP